MSDIVIRETDLADLDYIAVRLRDADRAEYMCATQTDPRETFSERLAAHSQYTALVDGAPTAVFGCTDYSSWGAPWLLGTDRLEGHQVALEMIRWGRELFHSWGLQYQRLYNMTYAKNHLHHKYIRLLGAKLTDQPILVNGHEFLEFTYSV